MGTAAHSPWALLPKLEGCQSQKERTEGKIATLKRVSLGAESRAKAQ